jgi:hypothetical protein
MTVVDSTSAPAGQDLTLRLEAYRTAVQTRSLEINLFWQRSNYFLVLNTATAAGFFPLRGDPRFSPFLACFGLLVAVLWVLTNLGSKFWQVSWEQRARLTEKELALGVRLFSEEWEKIGSGVEAAFAERERAWPHRLYETAVMWKPSVSLVMTLLSVLFTLFWLGALILAAWR